MFLKKAWKNSKNVIIKNGKVRGKWCKNGQCQDKQLKNGNQVGKKW